MSGGMPLDDGLGEDTLLWRLVALSQSSEDPFELCSAMSVVALV